MLQDRDNAGRASPPNKRAVALQVDSGKRIVGFRCVDKSWLLRSCLPPRPPSEAQFLHSKKREIESKLQLSATGEERLFKRKSD